MTKTLLFDIETAPLQAYTWGIWEVDVGLNQIIKHSSIIAWAAKWRGEKNIFYGDQRGKKNIYDDKELLRPLWHLLDEADVVVTQNGKKFDSKRVNARFIINGFPPPSPYKHLDTKIIAKRHFGFTSNRLEYLTEALCKKHVKQKHKKFPGFELWKECLAGNPAAWKEMEQYNKADVLSLEELFSILAPWEKDTTIVTPAYSNTCVCGSTKYKKNGIRARKSGIFQTYLCVNCGAHYQTRISSGVKSSITRKRA